MSKYEPLRQYLVNIQRTVSEKTLSLSEIERILGFKLPKSAYEHRAWWGNPTSAADHPHAQSWLAAGWIVDTVNQRDKWVRFRRLRSTVVQNPLADLGFEEVGEWLFKDGSLQFTLTRHRDERNILYAFVAKGEVKYIGKSSQTLNGRMNGYKQPGPTQSTNINNNARIKDLLLKGIPVQIFVFVQKEEVYHQGVPINLAGGLEDGLIARFRPPWNNRRGTR